MSAAPWWTEADAAELDVLAWHLVDAAMSHRECARCRELNTWCPPMAEAAEAVFDWRRRRSLLSRAEHVRVRTLVRIRFEAGLHEATA